MNKDIKKVADTITEKPIEITVTREPDGWIDRLLIRMGWRSLTQTFFIKPPSLRLAYTITSLFTELETSKPLAGEYNDWGNNIRSKNTKIMALIIATYVHGRPKEKTPQHLVDFFLDNITDSELEAITTIIKDQLDIVPFLNSIALIRSLDLISPALKASPADTGEIIAPGESSVPQQNTSGSV